MKPERAEPEEEWMKEAASEGVNTGQLMYQLQELVSGGKISISMLQWVADHPEAAAIWLRRAPEWPDDIRVPDVADLGHNDHVTWADLEVFADSRERRKMDPQLSSRIDAHITKCTLCMGYMQIHIPCGPEHIKVTPAQHHPGENRSFQDILGANTSIGYARALEGSGRDDQ